MKHLLIVLTLSILGLSRLQPAYGDESISDGAHDAEVTTPSGTYSVEVEVSGGEVESVHWPNGGDMTLHGADLDSSGDATGTNSRGDTIEVHVEE